jgi:hypothetical protein
MKENNNQGFNPNQIDSGQSNFNPNFDPNSMSFMIKNVDNIGESFNIANYKNQESNNTNPQEYKPDDLSKLRESLNFKIPDFNPTFNFNNGENTMEFRQPMESNYSFSGIIV